MAHYVTRDEVRTELGLPGLADAVVDRLIRNAEVLVENALNPRPVVTTGPQSGLRVAEADVEAWQWTRLREAILALTRRLHTQPDLLGPEYESVSGPDFSRGKRVAGASVFGNEVESLLRASGLLVRGARARP